MNTTLQFVLKRLSEASTYAAIAGGITAAATVPDTATKALVIAAALVGVFKPEAAKAA
ncbi:MULTISPECIES: hypothetical protein [unclassified Caballeronia]|uniref:hypothetical protein n=1 Tax=unclassified Caballeronia TaxID=2646786 RepID=UPI002027DD8A|nr:MULTISPECIES: hypothetical protein [unclassified Caballeronia]